MKTYENWTEPVLRSWCAFSGGAVAWRICWLCARGIREAHKLATIYTDVEWVDLPPRWEAA